MVVPKMFAHDHAYIFQNADRRIIFAIPYEQDFTLIGTTDLEYHGKIGQAHIDASEIAYLCEQASRYSRRRSRCKTWSGVIPGCGRCLMKVTAPTLRRSRVTTAGSGPPRRTADVDLGWQDHHSANWLRRRLIRLRPCLGQARPSWTADAVLPGGDLRHWGVADALRPLENQRLKKEAARRFPVVPEAVRRRWLRSYGTRMAQLLAEHALGDELAPGLYDSVGGSFA